MKKILLCLFALLLLCGCAEAPQEIPVQPQDSTPAPLPEEAILPDAGQIMSVSPSYDTRYFARNMPLLMEDDAQQAFCEAYTQVLSAATKTNNDLPEGDEYAFTINISGSPFIKKYLRLIDAGDNFYLELTQRKADWCLTYTLPAAAAQPLLGFFEGEPTGKPHIEGHPYGRVVPLAECLEKEWPLIRAEVVTVSDEVKEFKLSEGMRYGWLYREFTVKILHSFHGVFEGELTYRMFGGENDDYSFSVADAPQVQAGDIVFIAAEENSFITPYNLFHYDEYGYSLTIPSGFLPDSYGTAPRTLTGPALNQCLRTTHDAVDRFIASRNTRPDRVCEQELTNLKLRYPPSGPAWESMLSPVYWQDTWEDLKQNQYPLNLALLDFTEEQFMLLQDGTVQEGHDLLFPQDGWIILFARVEKIFYGCEDLREGDMVPVVIGSYIMAYSTIRSILSGKQVLGLIEKRPENPDFFPMPHLYALSLTDTFTLTQEEVVIYAGQEVECLEDCSGMYLDTFLEVIGEKLFSD